MRFEFSAEEMKKVLTLPQFWSYNGLLAIRV